MIIGIDTNKLITIHNPNIPQNKEYNYNVGGYRFSDFDKGIITYHKKQIKLINLKNLGDGMGIFYINTAQNLDIQLDKDSFISAICSYQSYDEQTNQKYYFLPKISEKELDKLNNIITKLSIQIKLKKTSKGIIVQDNQIQVEGSCFLSKIFAWIIIYGKFDIRKNELLSFKFHLPLFGGYMSFKDELDKNFEKIKKIGLFFKIDTLQTKDGLTYQVSSNDYELLQIFGKWYQSIENTNRIPKYDQIIEAKNQLLDFIQNDPQVPNDGKEQTIQAITNGTIKLLIK